MWWSTKLTHISPIFSLDLLMAPLWLPPFSVNTLMALLIQRASLNLTKLPFFDTVTSWIYIFFKAISLLSSLQSRSIEHLEITLFYLVNANWRAASSVLAGANFDILNGRQSVICVQQVVAWLWWDSSVTDRASVLELSIFFAFWGAVATVSSAMWRVYEKDKYCLFFCGCLLCNKKL